MDSDVLSKAERTIQEAMAKTACQQGSLDAKVGELIGDIAEHLMWIIPTVSRYAGNLDELTERIGQVEIAQIKQVDNGTDLGTHGLHAEPSRRAIDTWMDVMIPELEAKVFATQNMIEKLEETVKRVKHDAHRQCDLLNRHLMTIDKAFQRHTGRLKKDIEATIVEYNDYCLAGLYSDSSMSSESHTPTARRAQEDSNRGTGDHAVEERFEQLWIPTDEGGHARGRTGSTIRDPGARDEVIECSFPDGGGALEREVRFAKLTVKLLLAAEVKEDVTIQLVELRFARYQADCQLVSKIIARMGAIIEKDAREPREILAKGAIPFLPDDWWIEFTAGYFFGDPAHWRK